MKNSWYPFIAIALLSLAYCKSTQKVEIASTANVKGFYEPSAKQLEIAEKRWPNTLVTEIQEGQNIYVTKCTECHGAYTIIKFSEKKWLHEIEEMSPKASLTSEEKLKLSKHILSYREANVAVKPK